MTEGWYQYRSSPERVAAALQCLANGERPPVRIWTAENVAAALKMVASGVLRSEVARHFKSSRYAMDHAFRRARIYLPKGGDRHEVMLEARRLMGPGLAGVEELNDLSTKEPPCPTI